MGNFISPQENDRMVDEEVEKKIQRIQSHYSDQEQMMKIKTPAYPEPLDKSLTAHMGGMGCSLTLILGTALCVCYFAETTTTNFGSGISDMMAAYVVAAPVAYVIAFFMSKTAKNTYNKKVKNYQLEQDKINNCLIALEKTKQEEIERVKREGEDKKRRYYQEFEKHAQDSIKRFANSSLVKEIVDWMAAGFFRQINAANRSSYIPEILVPFEFTVCENAVICNLGVFDFKEKRCRPIQDPEEQFALCKAISADLQLEIMTKYPKDVSGTKVNIRMEQSYWLPQDVIDRSIENPSDYKLRFYNISDCPKATITYAAVNGNYQNLRDW